MTANKKKHTALKTVRNILLILFAVCVIAAGAVTLRGYHMYTCARTSPAAFSTGTSRRMASAAR